MSASICLILRIECPPDRHRRLPARVALAAPQPRLEVDDLPVGRSASPAQHLGRDQHDVPAGAFELDEITGAEVGEAGGVERDHGNT